MIILSKWLNSSIQPTDGILTDTANPGQSGPGSNGYVIYILQNSTELYLDAQLYSQCSRQDWFEWTANTYVCMYVHFWCKERVLSCVYIYLPNPFARIECETRSIFKRSLTALNSKFSFSFNGCDIKVKAPSLPFYLFLAERRNDGYLPFLTVRKMPSDAVTLWLLLWILGCSCCKTNHHHHHVVLLARISLTLSRHFSLSFIATGWSSGLHPVSPHCCCMYVRAGRPAFARPYVGVHRSTSLISSSLLLQQCPACLVRLAWIVFLMGGR